MEVPATYRRPPRGRSLIGFQLETPREVELQDGEVLHCHEVRHGRTLGELEITVFAAALIIDRDGLLAQQACAAIDREARPRGGATAVAVQLPGGSGFRAEAVQRTELPYLCVFAVAAHDLGIDGGVLITVRSARPEWPAAERMLGSLRIVTRQGVARASDAAAGLLLPVVELAD